MGFNKLGRGEIIVVEVEDSEEELDEEVEEAL